MPKATRSGPAFLAVLTLSSCATLDEPRNLERVAAGRAYQAQYRSFDPDTEKQKFLRSETMNAQSCKPWRGGTGGKGAGFANTALQGERLTRNDLVNIRVADDETFNGDYVVSRDGTIKLPFLSPIRAQGQTTRTVENAIAARLLSGDFFEERPRISVRVTDLASVSVGVSGAVFAPHVIQIGGVGGERVDSRRQGALGASTEGRNLSAALRAAGGVRPDADISAVELRRHGRKYVLDMRGVFEGKNAVDIMLLTDDEVFVPSRNCFQDDLMRPSPISPPGISLFLSNLIVPPGGNASAAVGRDVREIPYGTRYMQAVIDMNCVGGVRMTSAARSAALFSRNPVTKVSAVIERSIEPMMRRADRDDYDPYLLPGDSIACYDSAVTNLSEIGSLIGVFKY